MDWRKWIHVIVIFTIVLLTGCSRPTSRTTQGYVEGRYTYVATPVAGILKQLLVKRGAEVKQGQLLFALEEQPEIDAYKAAAENYKESISSRDAIAANLTFAKLTYERDDILVKKHVMQQAELDNARSRYEALSAQLSQANATIASAFATLAQAKWRKDQKTTVAPVDAEVFDIYYRLGEYTLANQPILSLLAPADIKAIFYVVEGDLGLLHLRDPVTVRCDGCDKDYMARISFISPNAEYTPPVIYSNETDAKLIYRIEAEFDQAAAKRMHPGQPIRVTYRTHGK